MSELGYPLPLRHPAPGAENPMDPYSTPIVKELYISKLGEAQFEYYDYITCEDEDGVPYYVAKPWLLRAEARTGLVLDMDSKAVTLTQVGGYSTMTASASGESDETWKITPPYGGPSGATPGEKITAVYKDTGVKDSNDKYIEWEDTNRAGRSWGVE